MFQNGPSAWINRREIILTSLNILNLNLEYVTVLNTWKKNFIVHSDSIASNIIVYNE